MAGVLPAATRNPALLSDLAGGRADGRWQSRIRRYVSPELLIVDDFAMGEYTPSQAENLYELVGCRRRRGSLIATTNRQPKDLYPLFPNPVLAEGLLDRLINSAHVVTPLGRSMTGRMRSTAARWHDGCSEGLREDE